jgi:hypothetical protein
MGFRYLVHVFCHGVKKAWIPASLGQNLRTLESIKKRLLWLQVAKLTVQPDWITRALGRSTNTCPVGGLLQPPDLWAPCLSP